MTLFFRNCKVLPMTAAAGEPNCFDGYVGVEGRRIALVTADAAAAEAWRAAHAGAREIDGRGGILMPGLVNTHCHMAMTLQRSYADDMALMEWLNDHIWPFEARQTDDDIRVGALLGAAEMLLGGVTSVVDMYWSEAAVFDAVDRAGMRALLCASYLDTRLEAFESDLPALVEKCEGSSRIRAGLAPHAAYTCSAENLRRGMEACRRYGIPMTTHIAETLDEVRMIRERYGARGVSRFAGSARRGADRRTLRAPDRRGSPHPARAGRARGALPDEQHEDRERRRADRTAAYRRGELYGGHRRPQFEQRCGRRCATLRSCKR